MYTGVQVYDSIPEDALDKWDLIERVANADIPGASAAAALKLAEVASSLSAQGLAREMAGKASDLITRGLGTQTQVLAVSALLSQLSPQPQPQLDSGRSSGGVAL